MISSLWAVAICSPLKLVQINHSLLLPFPLVPSCFKKASIGKQHFQIYSLSEQRSHCSVRELWSSHSGEQLHEPLTNVPPWMEALFASLSEPAEYHCHTTAHWNISTCSACQRKKADSWFSPYHSKNHSHLFLPKMRLRVRAEGVHNRSASKHLHKHPEIK